MSALERELRALFGQRLQSERVAGGFHFVSYRRAGRSADYGRERIRADGGDGDWPIVMMFPSSASAPGPICW